MDLLEDAFREQAIQCNEKITIDDKEIEWLKDISHRGDFGALWRGNQLIGLYLLQGDELDHIAVLSKFKGLGYGTIILKYCMREMFINRNCRQIKLCTYKINYKAQKLYIKNGFRISAFYSLNEHR
ncbi:Acetyltransferase (GNAT) family protein [Hathewaya proteolytica DSM 3090]|uniref:Acetyltransferase (GNAT) family protein n=1 Tax=Hathewaya proteolytica DSM 3090 TaxID=1121331 RepID=A0A1M6NWS0_9CLOT|nr:GNAT family N-acetyltransferase [Hathewaya proteolytica]SHK00187.1 Acetyltransferase (GNAT) family protein [Hathewaya proteolytica DSM 3090]